MISDLDPSDALIFALDVPRVSEALEWANRLEGTLRWLKVGSRLFTAGGPQLLEALVARGFKVFLDLKFHDIPNVVAGAVRGATARGASMISVHCLGGPSMLRAALDAARDEAELRNLKGPALFGITILTSLSSEELQSTGIHETAEEMVDRLAKLSLETGLHGVVCSPLEARRVKTLTEGKLKVLAPGIRPDTSDWELRPEICEEDQVRMATPGEAIRAGADYLVVGRPIRLAKEPLEVISLIHGEMRQAYAKNP